MTGHWYCQIFACIDKYDIQRIHRRKGIAVVTSQTLLSTNVLARFVWSDTMEQLQYDNTFQLHV